MRRRLRRVLHRHGRFLAWRLRAEEGFGLVELLIAMVVTAIAVTALVAALSSAYVSTIRASRISTAAAVANAELENYRALRYSEIALQAATSVSRQGADGRMYPVVTTVVQTCPNGSTPTAGACTTGGGRPLKSVSVEVREPTTSAVLARVSSAFDELTGS